MPADRETAAALSLGQLTDEVRATAEIFASVIVPARDEERLLSGCLESLARLEPFGGRPEVIVVDHCSTDRTAAIARGLGAIVLETAAPTIAAVRNHGARAARGHFLAFLDADCRVDPAWLNTALPHFQSPHVVAVGVHACAPVEGASWVQDAWSFLFRKPEGRSVVASWLPTSNLIVRASAFRRVGGFDESMETCEDVDLSYRLREVGSLVHDPSLRVIDLGLPPTLRQFFLSEFWHGKDSYVGMRKGRIVLGELPSLVVPVLCLLGVLLSSIGLILGMLGEGWSCFWIGGGGLLGPPLVYTARALLTKGRARHLPRFLLIYLTYFLARGARVLPLPPPWLHAAQRHGARSR